MSKKTVLFTSVVPILSLAVTLISWVYEQDLSQGLGVSKTGYGFPLSWYKKSVLVYPGSLVTYSFSLESFVLDLVFWSLIVGVLAIVVFRRQVGEKLRHNSTPIHHG